MKLLAVIFLFAGFAATAQKQDTSFRLARSSGKLPMLSYGLGEDRLGKLQNLDTLILLFC